MKKMKAMHFGRFTKFSVWAFALLLLLSACGKDEPAPVLPTLPDPEEEPGDGGNIPDFGISAIDDQMTDFMSRYNIPGASIAISRNGKLVYAKGYGWSDREAAVPV